MRIALVLTLAVALAGALAPVASTASGKGYAVGDKVADFSLPTTGGKSVKLSDYKGKVVVIQLLAHW